MHIAFLNPQGNFDPEDSYWAEHPDFGGQLVYVKEVAWELARLGHKVDILTRKIIDPDWPEFSNDMDAYPGQTNLRIIRIPCGPLSFLPKEELWPFLGTEWAPNILAFYQQEKQTPDVYTAHYGDGGLVGAILQQTSGVPFTFTAHSLGAQKMDKLGVTSHNIAEFEPHYHFTSRIAAEQVGMNHAAGIITSTRQEKDTQYSHPAYQGAIDGSEKSKFSVIPPGVNLHIFSQNSTDLDHQIAARINKIVDQSLPPSRAQLPFVLSASRLDPKKNLIGLLRAFTYSEELQQISNLMLAVRGPEDSFNQEIFFNNPDNAVLQEIKAVVDQHDLADKVLAIPLNSQQELASAYRYAASQMSVFILPALYEPFGLAPLEAMACGLPAVVTQNGGPTESMVENSNEFGILIDPENPAHMAEGLLRLLRSEDEWRNFQKAGAARVMDKYTWPQTARGYADAFENITSSEGGLAQTDYLSIPQFFFKPTAENAIPQSMLSWLEN
jgi:sucrose-phosphate synthase